MSWDRTIRESHRWVSLAFTGGVIANLVALWGKQQSTIIGLLALIPLIILLLSGLYLFVRPFLLRRRRVSHVSGAAGRA
ncbi:MAG: hypothetical protein U0164_22285 [Gemmatimonadaceae bacterium]